MTSASSSTTSLCTTITGNTIGSVGGSIGCNNIIHNSIDVDPESLRKILREILAGSSDTCLDCFTHAWSAFRSSQSGPDAVGPDDGLWDDIVSSNIYPSLLSLRPSHIEDDLYDGTASSIDSSSDSVRTVRPPLIQPAIQVEGEGAEALLDVGVPSKDPLIDSHGEDKRKFTLKELLPATPLLQREYPQTTSRDSYAKDNASEKPLPLTHKYRIYANLKLPSGEGATSIVRLAEKWDTSDEKSYAVKKFRKRHKTETEKEYVKKLTAEYCISSTLHHINLVETYDLLQDGSRNWCLVTEFCPGGDLHAALKKGGMSPSEVECCFKQILLGVSYLQSHGVAHRDLKPENLFFDNQGHLKIGNYGSSTVYRLPWEATVHMSIGLCGSGPYIAPERFLGRPYDARLVDIWSCGIIYYYLHSHEPPWQSAQTQDSSYSAYAAACAASTDSGATNGTSTAALGGGGGGGAGASSNIPNFPKTITNLSPRASRSLIRRMLEPNPRERAAIDEVMRHSWVEEIEVCYLATDPKHVHDNANATAAALMRAR